MPKFSKKDFIKMISLSSLFLFTSGFGGLLKLFTQKPSDQKKEVAKNDGGYGSRGYGY